MRDNPYSVFLIAPTYAFLSMPTSLVLANDQAAIDGIRSVGAKQLIIAPGNGFTGGHSWLQNSQGDDPSGDFLFMLKDPINNTAIDIHEVSILLWR